MEILNINYDAFNNIENLFVALGAQRNDIAGLGNDMRIMQETLDVCENGVCQLKAGLNRLNDDYNDSVGEYSTRFREIEATARGAEAQHKRLVAEVGTVAHRLNQIEERQNVLATNVLRCLADMERRLQQRSFVTA